MRSLSRISLRHGGGGDPLPPVFTTLYNRGVKPRLGQTMLIAGPPKAFKSGFAQYWTVRLAQRGLGVLYFSADTDPEEVKIRVAAMLTGHRTDHIEESLLDGDAEEFYNEALEELAIMKWDFHSSPDYDRMTELILAYGELWGEYPRILVLDNLMNAESLMEDQYRGYKELQLFLKDACRQIGAAGIILHHTNEGKDPRFPAPRKDVAGKVNQIPAIVLSIAADDGVVRVSPVANRSGYQDPTGEWYAEFAVDINRMAIAANKYNLQNGILL